MDRNELYSSIAERTGGDIYIGVVGPVRTGKSTFIKRFMDMLVMPGITDEYERARLTDELPQSAAGRTIMTTQPSFVPNEAAELTIGEDAACRVRLVDCVGYMVPGAVGHEEDNMPRMVRTPWSEEEMPFDKAAEIGTRKVITDHSTIGIVMTTDGSITQIPREDYVAAEERVINELKEQGKPFAVILNSTRPNDADTAELAANMQQKYDVPVTALDVLNLSAEQLNNVLELVLMEFPIRSVAISIPDWVGELGMDHYLLQRIMEPLSNAGDSLSKMRCYADICSCLSDIEDYEAPRLERVSLGNGKIAIEMRPVSSMFYKILGEECGYEIKDDAHLVASRKSFVAAKKEFDRIEGALRCAKSTGYGMVPPELDEMVLEEPEIVRQGNRFGVRLKAKSSGLHIIKVDIASEVAPLVGTEEQSEAFMAYLMETFEKDPQKLWETDIFGKSLRDMIRESMAVKVNAMPENVQLKLHDTVEKMVNDGCSGLICIML